MCRFGVTIDLSGESAPRDWLDAASAPLAHQGSDAGTLHVSTSAARRLGSTLTRARASADGLGRVTTQA